MKVKRRELLLASLAATASAQQKPEEPTDQIRRQMQASQKTLSQFKVPITTQPAFVFKA